MCFGGIPDSNTLLLSIVKTSFSDIRFIGKSTDVIVAHVGESGNDTG